MRFLIRKIHNSIYTEVKITHDSTTIDLGLLNTDEIMDLADELVSTLEALSDATG
jgi:hypothetical protein